MHPQVQRASTAVFDGVEVELFIDHVAIMKLFGPRAARSRGGKAQSMRGLILARRVPKRKPKRMFRL